MPKQRITKEMVVDAAFELAREGGMEQVLVKNIAERLGCSVQPIYSYCANMEGLKRDLQERTGVFFREYAAAHADPENVFRSTGHAYLQLAKEEPHLYALYFQSLRYDKEMRSLGEVYENECDPRVARGIAGELGISLEAARKLHFHMTVYNAGLSAMLIASRFCLETEELERQLDRAYEAFRQQALSESFGKCVQGAGDGKSAKGGEPDERS